MFGLTQERDVNKINIVIATIIFNQRSKYSGSQSSQIVVKMIPTQTKAAYKRTPALIEWYHCL